MGVRRRQAQHPSVAPHNYHPGPRCFAQRRVGNAECLGLRSLCQPRHWAGTVRIINDAAQVDQVLKGDILVTEITTPDFVPAMKRAAAIVNDRGGRTCHAAIVSREMGLPCIVDTIDGTTKLRDIPVATVDGGAGEVYEGDHQTKLVPQVIEIPTDANLTTKTKLYVNLADPDSAQRVAAMCVDGVGLLRAEFMIAQLGEHPRSMLESGRA